MWSREILIASLSVPQLMAANDSLQFFRHRLVGIINHNYEIALLFLGGKNDKNYKMQQLNKKNMFSRNINNRFGLKLGGNTIHSSRHEMGFLYS